MKLKDLHESKVEFTLDEKIDLALFGHDKGHVINRGGHVSAMDKALKYLSKKSSDLWRGLYPEEIKLFDQDLEVDCYLSFSENREIAEGFAKRSKVLLHAKSLTGFCYWQWGVADHLEQQEENPKVWDENDGQYSLDVLKKEAEWVIGHGTVLKVVDRKQDGEFTIIELEQVWT